MPLTEILGCPGLPVCGDRAAWSQEPGHLGRAVFELQKQISPEFLLLLGSADITLDQEYVHTYSEVQPRTERPPAAQSDGEGRRPGKGCAK